MTRSIAVAAIQLRARDRDDFVAAAEAALDAVRRCAHADVVVLPEATFPAYVLGDAPLDDAAVGDAIARLREIARSTKTVIVAGVAAREEEATRNSAFVIDVDGSLAGRADKLFLWHFDRRWFSRGDRLAPVRTSVATLGVMICADGRLPTVARALVDRGAELLVMPTAWVTSGRDPAALENVQADVLGRVRAYENRVPFVAANKCGTELDMVAYCGKSQIVDSRGEIVALADQDRPESLHASVELSAERPARVQTELLVPRTVNAERPVRIAIAYDELPSDIDRRLEMLEDEFAISRHDDERFAALDRVVPAAFVDDARVLDPGGLVPYRRAGYWLICWRAGVAPPWVERIARARAVELRIHLVVFDRAQRRAFAVDPDGTILAGTFGDYRLATFAFDPRRSMQTAVAPGTDIVEGLRWVAALSEREDTVAT
ncbi:MAG TPA: carbon-nitrogen hydrolase family protein [Candidatus Binatia bacterium]|nr:carbon-nitrogen hydrolase family protein [Candidatus Binatia bacterium]